MSEHKSRYRETVGCRICDKELKGRIPGECCPDCGGTFMGGAIDHSFIVHEDFIHPKRVWWKPSTWFGYWKRIGEEDGK